MGHWAYSTGLILNSDLLSGSAHLLKVSMSSSTWTKGPWSKKKKTKKTITRSQTGRKNKTPAHIFYFIASKFELDSVKLLLLTVKHVGGGSSFIRITAAGGTGKTPPGTGCKPGAVGGGNTRSYVKDKTVSKSSGNMQHTGKNNNM